MSTLKEQIGISMSAVQRKNSPFRMDMKAVELFNEVKAQMKKQVGIMNALKREVTRSEILDQGAKSRLRIQIESILIDLNEEIFAISEDLSSAFVESRPDSEELYKKAQEYEQRKIRLFTKIRQSISNNPLMTKIKKERSLSAERDKGAGDYSPPQREKEVKQISDKRQLFRIEETPKVQSISNKLGTTPKTSNQSVMYKEEIEQTPGNHYGQASTVASRQNSRNKGPYNMPRQIPSTTVSAQNNNSSVNHLMERQYSRESVETFGHERSSPILKNIRNFTQSVASGKAIGRQQRASSIKTFPKSRICESNSKSRSRSRSKSPIQPLRNRAESSQTKAPKQDRFGNYQSQTQLINVVSQRRQSRRTLSKQCLQSKKALHKLYTMNLERKRGSGSRGPSHPKPLRSRADSARVAVSSYKIAARGIPKFTGCGPGGVGASMMASHASYSLSSAGESAQMNRKSTVPDNLPRPTKKEKTKRHNFKPQNNENFDLQAGDRSLLQARRESAYLVKPIANHLLSDDLEKDKSTNTIDIVDQGRRATEQKQYSDVENPLRTIYDASSMPLQQSPLRGNASSKDINKSTIDSGNVQTVSFERAMQNIQGLQNAPADAVLQFSRDFDLMRKKFQDMQHTMTKYTTSIADLNKQVTRLTYDNHKLTSDLKLIQGEHSDMTQAFQGLEQKHQELRRENLTLKDIIYQNKVERGEAAERAGSSSVSPGIANAISEMKPFERPPKPTMAYKLPQTALPPALRTRSKSSQDRDAPQNESEYIPLRDRSSSPKARHISSFQQILESPFSNAMAKKSSRERIAMRQVEGQYSEPEIRGIHNTNSIGPADRQEPYDIARHEAGRAHLGGPFIPENRIQPQKYAPGALAFPPRSARGSEGTSPADLMCLQRVQMSPPKAQAQRPDMHSSSKKAFYTNETQQNPYSYVNTNESVNQQTSPLRQAPRQRNTNQYQDQEDPGLSSWVLERMKPTSQNSYNSQNIKV